jgi:hypothetical protein
MKSMLKDRKKAKTKSDEPKEEGSLTDELLGELEGTTEESKKDEPESKDADPGDDAKADVAPATPADGGDPVKVFQDILDVDEMTAQAVFAEASAMPELSEMSPDQMAKKIKGNYEMLKKILTSMGEKAKMAMDEQLNQPMDMPADLGGDMGAGPAPGPGAGGPPPLG